MSLRLAALLLVWSPIVGCKRSPAEPPSTVAPATIQLGPQRILIGGKVANGPDGAREPASLRALRESVKEALRREKAGPPTLVVAPEVISDALYEAFDVLVWADRQLDRRPVTEPPAARPLPYVAAVPVERVVQVRLQCLGSDRVWELLAPTYGEAALGKSDDPGPLLFTIAIGAEGFYLAAAGGVLPGATDPDAGPKSPGAGQSPPAIPRVADKLDFGALRTRVAAVKRSFPNERQVIVAADGNSGRAEDLCRVLEAVTPSFPEVVLGSF